MANFFESELFAELSEDLKQSSRFTATYRIAAPDYEEAKKLAFGICVEQTVECPYELVKGTPIADSIVGQIDDLKKAPEPGTYYATISYDPEAVGDEMAELINMLFGNTSLQPGIRLMSFDLPEGVYDNYPVLVSAAADFVTFVVSPEVLFSCPPSNRWANRRKNWPKWCTTWPWAAAPSSKMTTA